MRLSLLGALILGGLLASHAVLAQPGPPVQRAPQGVQPRPAPTPYVGMVGIITGGIDSTAIQIASDLSRAFDEGNALRIVPIVGRGSLQNISDLLNLRGVDIAILQSDVLAYFRRTNRIPGLENRIRYVTKLYSEEFHVLSRMQFTCLADLAGRRVNFGPKDSGMAITAEAVFAAHKVSIQPVYLDHDVALERLKAGEIDALVYIGGKPTRGFERITHKDRVHFLDVDYLPELQGEYLPAIMTAEDYPELIAPAENVSTIGVSAVMAINNWNPQTERYRVMARFVEKFFNGKEALKQDPYSRKWQEVNLRAPITGWERFQPAERWLIANAEQKVAPAVPPQTAQQLRTMLQKFVESQRGGSSADREELFNQFVRWYQQQSGQQQ
jgi:TRAP transporter TAXI family solute receptor